MPLDESAGCLLSLLRAVFGFLGHVADFLPTARLANSLGWIGSKAIWLLTLSRYKPSDESYECIAVGFLILVAALIIVGLADY